MPEFSTLREDEVRHLYYVRLTQALHAAVAEAIEKNGAAHRIDVLGQFKRFERVIEDAAGSPQARVSGYPE